MDHNNNNKRRQQNQQQQQKTTRAKRKAAGTFAINSMLVLSLLAATASTTGLVSSSFATTSGDDSSSSSAPIVAIQHVLVPNSSSTSNSITIEKITMTAKAMKTMPASNVQIQIVQDGKVKGSTKVDSNLFSLTMYKGVNAKFDPPVKVKGNFDVVFRGNGLTVLIVRESGQTIIPGHVTIPDKVIDDKQLDAYFTINGKSVAEALANATSTGNENINNNSTSNSSQPPATPSQQQNSQGSFTLTVNTIDSTNNPITGYYTTLSSEGMPAKSEFSPASFAVDSSHTYQISVSDYGSYAFDHWSDTGSTERSRSISSLNADMHLIAVYKNINGNTATSTQSSTQLPPASSPAGAGSITVYAYRIPSQYWGPTFASANADMYFALYDDKGTLVATGFANENGHTFTGLNSGAAYYVSPSDCDGCHNSDHDVVFRHWEDNSTTRMRMVSTGSSVGAYFEYVPWN